LQTKKKIIQQSGDEQAPEREQPATRKIETENRIDQYRKLAAENVNIIRVRIEQYQATSFDQTDSQDRVAVLNKNINDALDRIDLLETEKFDLDDGSKQLEAEVGPIKYVVEMVADMTGSQVDIEDAVRWMIMVLIFVFDPLAILLVIAAHISLANQNLRWFKSSKPVESINPVDVDTTTDVIEKNFDVPREFLK